MSKVRAVLHTSCVAVSLAADLLSDASCWLCGWTQSRADGHVAAPGIHGCAHDGRRNDVPAGARLSGELPGAHLLPALHPVHLRVERCRYVA